MNAGSCRRGTTMIHTRDEKNRDSSQKKALKEEGGDWRRRRRGNLKIYMTTSHPTIITMTSWGCLATVATNKATGTPKAKNVYAKPARTVISSSTLRFQFYDCLFEQLEGVAYTVLRATPPQQRETLLLLFLCKRTTHCAGEDKYLLQSRQRSGEKFVTRTHY